MWPFYFFFQLQSGHPNVPAVQQRLDQGEDLRPVETSSSPSREVVRPMSPLSFDTHRKGVDETRQHFENFSEICVIEDKGIL